MLGVAFGSRPEADEPNLAEGHSSAIVDNADTATDIEQSLGMTMSESCAF